MSLMGSTELLRAGDFGLNEDAHMAEWVASVLRRGLGDRIQTLFTRMHSDPEPWGVNQVCLEHGWDVN